MIDYNKALNNRIKTIKPSGIRRFFDIAAEMDDVISLSVGEPGFKTPERIREAGMQSLREGRTFYTGNSGLTELRKEISLYLERRFQTSYDPLKEIVVTVGGSEAIDTCIRAIIEQGDEVLVPEPSFVCYSPITTLQGGVAVPIVTKAEDEFRLTAQALREKITDRTKLLILPFPNNPTGGIMEKEDLEAIAEVVKDTNIIVLSDEIYGELTYGGKSHVSFASIPGMRERTIVVNGFSKAYAMTGWRLGYAAGPVELISQMTKIHQFGIMSAPTTAQFAAIKALRDCDDEIRYMVEEYDKRRRLIVDGLNRLGLTCFEPRGAFYAFPSIQSTGLSSEEFCTRLLKEKHVAVVPGDAFGESGEGFVRISYSYTVEHIKTALERIEEFLKSL